MLNTILCKRRNFEKIAAKTKKFFVTGLRFEKSSSKNDGTAASRNENPAQHKILIEAGENILAQKFFKPVKCQPDKQELAPAF